MTRILVPLAVLWLATTAIAAETPPAGAWTEAPDYARLFAPSGARAAAYQIYVSRLSIEDVLARLAAEPSLLRPPGAWTSAALLPSDAFGQTGNYDRSKLARLYGSKRALVAHGPRALSGAAPTEAWTLISPYPSADMTRLEAGTMLIVLNLALP